MSIHFLHCVHLFEPWVSVTVTVTAKAFSGFTAPSSGCIQISHHLISGTENRTLEPWGNICLCSEQTWNHQVKQKMIPLTFIWLIASYYRLFFFSKCIYGLHISHLLMHGNTIILFSVILDFCQPAAVNGYCTISHFDLSLSHTRTHTSSKLTCVHYSAKG